MAINVSKVITGGIAAGIVMNVVDFVSNFTFLKGPTEASMNALNPSIMPNMQHGGTVGWFVAIDLIMGIVLTFAYAAIRPRFGAGPRSATIAAFIVWATGCCLAGYFFVMGIFTPTLYWLSFFESFVAIWLGAYVGGMLYRETGETAPAAEAAMA